MGRVYSDTEKLIKAAELSSNGHHNQASRIYHDMGNENRNSDQKKSLWEMAKNTKKKGQ